MWWDVVREKRGALPSAEVVALDLGFPYTVAAVTGEINRRVVDLETWDDNLACG